MHANAKTTSLSYYKRKRKSWKSLEELLSWELDPIITAFFIYWLGTGLLIFPVDICALNLLLIWVNDFRVNINGMFGNCVLFWLRFQCMLECTSIREWHFNIIWAALKYFFCCCLLKCNRFTAVSVFKESLLNLSPPKVSSKQVNKNSSSIKKKIFSLFQQEL